LRSLRRPHVIEESPLFTLIPEIIPNLVGLIVKVIDHQLNGLIDFEIWSDFVRERTAATRDSSSSSSAPPIAIFRRAGDNHHHHDVLSILITFLFCRSVYNSPKFLIVLTALKTTSANEI
jgi:hypothetical protein